MWESVGRGTSPPALSVHRQLESGEQVTMARGPMLPLASAPTELHDPNESASGLHTTPDSAAHSSNPNVLRAVFTAKENVWIAIESDGNRTFTGTLEENQTTETTAGGKIVARVGNSGGVEVSINGKSLGPIGEHGQVRLLEVTPTGTRITTPTTVSSHLDNSDISN
jgi:hypothetical protein